MSRRTARWPTVVAGRAGVAGGAADWTPVAAVVELHTFVHMTFELFPSYNCLCAVWTMKMSFSSALQMTKIKIKLCDRKKKS